MSSKKFLICVVGPTAIGKTALGIRLAQHFGSEIISADSRQVFKEMRIGTAVPSNEELAAATHHFIQSHSIHQAFTAGTFEQQALSLLETLFQKNNIQLLVGGSGLYVDAVLKGLDTFPEVSERTRISVRELYEKNGLGALQTLLSEKDPDFFEHLTQNNPQTLQNPQRMMRYVEVCLSSGQPYSDFLKNQHKSREFTPIIIGLTAERDLLYKRINQRTDLMMQEGWLEEVFHLREFTSHNALQTVGYKELLSHLNGQISLDEAVTLIKQNTRRFAKRQLTWFNRTEGIQWFDFQTSIDTILEHIHQKIQHAETS
jgi:tRNA dimethylallyltransferase